MKVVVLLRLGSCAAGRYPASWAARRKTVGSRTTRGVAEDRAAGQIAATRYQRLISDRAKAAADLDSMMSEMRGRMKGQ
jgi:hypothetical protein